MLYAHATGLPLDIILPEIEAAAPLVEPRLSPAQRNHLVKVEFGAADAKTRSVKAGKVRLAGGGGSAGARPVAPAVGRTAATTWLLMRRRSRSTSSCKAAVLIVHAPARMRRNAHPRLAFSSRNASFSFTSRLAVRRSSLKNTAAAVRTFSISRCSIRRISSPLSGEKLTSRALTASSPVPSNSSPRYLRRFPDFW